VTARWFGQRPSLAILDETSLPIVDGPAAATSAPEPETGPEPGPYWCSACALDGHGPYCWRCCGPAELRDPDRLAFDPMRATNVITEDRSWAPVSHAMLDDAPDDAHRSRPW
jgi:hypothetical protein